MAANPIRTCISDNEAQLGALAMKFHATRDSAERDVIAKQYAKMVKELVKNSCWKEMPPPEDQLPDDLEMPESVPYWDYKSRNVIFAIPPE